MDKREMHFSIDAKLKLIKHFFFHLQTITCKREFETVIWSTLEIEIIPIENALKDRCQINMARKLVSRTSKLFLHKYHVLKKTADMSNTKLSILQLHRKCFNVVMITLQKFYFENQIDLVFEKYDSNIPTILTKTFNVYRLH